MNTQYINELPQQWQPVAKVFSALGDDTRQKILLLFEPGEELSIKDIAEVFPLSRTSIVHHLDVLERSGVMASRREGKLALYTIKPEVVMQAMTALRDYIMEELYE